MDHVPTVAELEAAVAVIEAAAESAHPSAPAPVAPAPVAPVSAKPEIPLGPTHVGP